MRHIHADLLFILHEIMLKSEVLISTIYSQSSDFLPVWISIH